VTSAFEIIVSQDSVIASLNTSALFDYVDSRIGEEVEWVVLSRDENEANVTLVVAPTREGKTLSAEAMEIIFDKIKQDPQLSSLLVVSFNIGAGTNAGSIVALVSFMEKTIYFVWVSIALACLMLAISLFVWTGQAYWDTKDYIVPHVFGFTALFGEVMAKSLRSAQLSCFPTVALKYLATSLLFGYPIVDLM
jgi:hypothetical protein